MFVFFIIFLSIFQIISSSEIENTDCRKFLYYRKVDPNSKSDIWDHNKDLSVDIIDSRGLLYEFVVTQAQKSRDESLNWQITDLLT